MSGPASVNGTYDQEVFTQRAVDIIQQHNHSENLYLYVAYHNVHDACQADRFALGLHAPKETVDVRPGVVASVFCRQASLARWCA